MLRAAAAPERFLGRGFARFLARPGVVRRREGTAPSAALDLGLTLPLDLASFIDAVSGGDVAEFRSTPSLPRLGTLIASTRRARGARPSRAHVQLTSLLAGAVPFGETSAGDPLVYFLADAPAGGVIAAIEPRRLVARLLCRGAAELAVICSLQAVDVEPEAPPFGIAEEEAVRARLERARSLALMLGGSDAQVRAAARAIALKPLDVPPPEGAVAARRPKKVDRTAPLALGPIIEAFFRESEDELPGHLAAHATSSDALVRDACHLLGAALAGKRTAPAKELARRRAIAQRALRPLPNATPPSVDAPMATTVRIVARFDALPPTAESYGALHEREETLLALAELGDPRVTSALLDRARAGDGGAVDMLAALGDPTLAPELLALLGGEQSRARLHEVAIVRALVQFDAKEAAPTLQQLLQANPMTGWREGLERSTLVRELVIAAGELQDASAAPHLVTLLESTSQEYRVVLPAAAYALGRLRHVPALAGLERLLFSPKEPVTCEAVWAVGAIGDAHIAVREASAALLDRLAGLEPGAEATRLAALAKMRSGKAAPRTADLRKAIERALWEPAFRQEESSRRRAWGLRALEELAKVAASDHGAKLDPSELFMGHETLRHLVTRDDHRVRRAANAAFGAWSLPVPKVRPYFSFALPELERRGGLEALIESVRDPLGVFRHNVATRLAEIGDERAVRPLAEATARLFAEPPTSTYEYDDAPPRLAAFVRALAKLNRPESNDVLIEGLRSDNHQVRAVVAENAPDDARFVPELMAMLGDPRSFLRSRAEKSLTSLGAIQAPVEPATTEVAALARREG